MRKALQEVEGAELHFTEERAGVRRVVAKEFYLGATATVEGMQQERTRRGISRTSVNGGGCRG